MLINIDAIDNICKEYYTCQKCSYGKDVHMGKYPKRVFYRGNTKANVAIIAEGPGIAEINQGIPLIGPSGKWLDGMLTAVGIPITDCLFLNTFVCSDDGKKKPTPDVLKACNDRIRLILETLDPKLIICLGKYALEAFQLAHYGAVIDSTLSPVSNFVGQHYNALSVKGKIIHWFVEYHPAYILRSGPNIKREARRRWENIAKIYKININKG